jgi:hypothetical protein
MTNTLQNQTAAAAAINSSWTTIAGDVIALDSVINLTNQLDLMFNNLTSVGINLQTVISTLNLNNATEKTLVNNCLALLKTDVTNFNTFINTFKALT